MLVHLQPPPRFCLLATSLLVFTIPAVLVTQYLLAFSILVIFISHQYCCLSFRTSYVVHLVLVISAKEHAPCKLRIIIIVKTAR